MRPTTKALCLCLSVLLLLLSLAACRNRDFNPAIPPPDEGDKNGDLPTDLACWVRLSDGTEYPLAGEAAAELYTAVKKIYESSDTMEAIPDRGESLRLVFCMGAPLPRPPSPPTSSPTPPSKGSTPTSPTTRAGTATTSSPPTSTASG